MCIRDRFWQPNDHNTICALVVDVDHSDNWLLPMWELFGEHPELMPTWIIAKSDNGHGQLGWLIEPVATGPNSRRKPIDYAAAVLYALTAAFNGDHHFTNSRCWNPTWTGWSRGAGDVDFCHTAPRSLTALHAALVTADLWVTKPPENRRPTPVLHAEDAAGRNCHVFDSTRLRSHGTVADVAHAVNNQLANPLPVSEVEGIIRSIERWEATYGPPWARHGSFTVSAMSDEERELQRERGRRGGLANTAAQQQARAQGPAAASVTRSAQAIARAAMAKHYRDNGYTRKQIAEKMNTSPENVKRWLKQSRES